MDLKFKTLSEATTYCDSQGSNCGGVECRFTHADCTGQLKACCKIKEPFSETSVTSTSSTYSCYKKGGSTSHTCSRRMLQDAEEQAFLAEGRALALAAPPPKPPPPPPWLTTRGCTDDGNPPGCMLECDYGGVNPQCNGNECVRHNGPFGFCMQGDAAFDTCECNGNCVGGDLAVNPRLFCQRELIIAFEREQMGRQSNLPYPTSYYCSTEPYASACRKTCGTCLTSESECTDAQIANGGAITAQQCEQWARGANKRFSTSEFSKDVHTGIRVSEPPMHTYQLVAVNDRGLDSPNINLAPYGGLEDGGLGGCRNCDEHHHNADCSSKEGGIEACQRLCSFLDECAGFYVETTVYPGRVDPEYRCCPVREFPEFPGGVTDKTDPRVDRITLEPLDPFGLEVHRKQDPIPSSVPHIEFGSDRGFSLATWIYRTRTGNNWDRLFELDTLHANTSNYDAATNPYSTRERMSEWMFAFQYNGVLRAIPGTGYYTCALNAANGFNLEVNNNRWVHFAVTVTPVGGSCVRQSGPARRTCAILHRRSAGALGATSGPGRR